MKQFVMNFLLVKNWNEDQIRRDELRQEVLFWKKLPLFLIFELTRCNSSGVRQLVRLFLALQTQNVQDNLETSDEWAPVHNHQLTAWTQIRPPKLNNTILIVLLSLDALFILLCLLLVSSVHKSTDFQPSWLLNQCSGDRVRRRAPCVTLTCRRQLLRPSAERWRFSRTRPRDDKNKKDSESEAASTQTRGRDVCLNPLWTFPNKPENMRKAKEAADSQRKTQITQSKVGM